jgi:cell division cycle 2-like protein
VVGSTMDKIFLVMEYVDHDMKVLLKQMEERKKKFKIGKYFPVLTIKITPFLAEIKTLMYQLLSGCSYLHSEWVLHRDLKTSNLLLTHNNVLKVMC